MNRKERIIALKIMYDLNNGKKLKAPEIINEQVDYAYMIQELLDEEYIAGASIMNTFYGVVFLLDDARILEKGIQYLKNNKIALTILKALNKI